MAPSTSGHRWGGGARRRTVGALGRRGQSGGFAAFAALPLVCAIYALLAAPCRSFVRGWPAGLWFSPAARSAVSREAAPTANGVIKKSIRNPPRPGYRWQKPLQVGSIHSGTVTSLHDFGVFVDISAQVDGLLHFSRMSRAGAADMKQIKKGQALTVMVSEVHADGKMSLTLLDGIEPDFGEFQEVAPDEWHEGEVRHDTAVGVVVNVRLPSGAQANGLLRRANIPEDAQFDTGENVKVRILSANKGKLELSMEDASAIDILRGLDGQWLPGRVATTSVDYGVFVRAEVPSGKTVSGLLHQFNYIGTGKPTKDTSLKVRLYRIKGDEVEWTTLEPGSEEPEKWPENRDLSAFEEVGSGTWLDGTITQKTKYGHYVSVTAPDSGITATGLVHNTRLSETFLAGVPDFHAVGDKVRARVTEVKGNYLTLSFKKQRYLETFDENEWHVGTIASNTPFGFFVDFIDPCTGDLVRGLVRRAQLKDGAATVENQRFMVKRALRIGKKVKVRVIAVDNFNSRVDLSMREVGAELPDDFPTFKGVGQEEWLNGIVTGVSNYGAWVSVKSPSGVTGRGLVHLAEIKEEFVKSASDEMKIGDVVRVRVLGINQEHKRLDLSMRKPQKKEERTASAAFRDVGPDEWLTGTVVNVKDFGAFVELPAPGGGASAKGLLPKAQVGKLAAGSSTEVRITKISPEGKITLTNRASPSSQDLSAFQALGADVWLDAKVTGLATYGVFVKASAPDMKSTAQGLVHSAELKHGSKVSSQAQFKHDQPVKVRVVSVKDGKIDFSMRDV